MEKKMWGLKILEGTDFQIVREADGDDEWDCGDTDQGGYCAGVEIGCEDECDMAVPWEPVPGEKIWLLWVTRSTGDTFHSESVIFEALAAFRSRENALQAQAELEAHAFLSSSAGVQPECAHGFSFSVLGEDGAPVVISAGWSGYFDSLDSVNVESFEPRLSEKLAKKMGTDRDGAPLQDAGSGRKPGKR